LIILKQWLKEVYTENNDMGQGWLKEKNSNSQREAHQIDDIGHRKKNGC
jgi:hypothetical protein